MSGQMLVDGAVAGAFPGDDRHLRIRAELSDGAVLPFVDQRTFGGWAVDPLRGGVRHAGPAVRGAHRARPLDQRFDRDAVIARMKRKDTEVKRVLLDQTVLSGVGNIYADEALWRSRRARPAPASASTKPALGRLIDDAADVMRRRWTRVAPASTRCT